MWPLIGWPRRHGRDVVKHLRSISEIGSTACCACSTSPTPWSRSTSGRTRRCRRCAGKTVCNLFFEDSTRTRLSFETAAKRLSADVMTFSVGTSSVNKGESLRDTIETVAAMGVDAFVIRHRSSGVPWQVSRWTTASIINGGDGWHAHPTQALLDAYTVRSALGRTGGLDGLRIGDRRRHPPQPGRSQRRRGVHRCSAPTSRSSPRRRCCRRCRRRRPPTTSTRSIEKVDVLYLLRMQRERMHEALVPSLREYSARFGLTPERARRLPRARPRDAPGPMNRGVEILVDPAELPGAVITQQVANGVAVRMAVLFDLLGSGTRPARARRDARADPRRARSLDQHGRAAGRRARRRRRRRRRRSTAPSATRDDQVLDATGCIVAPGLRRPPRPPARARPRGGRDDRDRQPGRGPRRLHGGRGDAEHRPAAGRPRRRRVRAGPGRARPGCARCCPAGCITMGRAGERSRPYAELVAAGVRIFTDDGNGVQDPLLMRRAMEYSLGLDMVLAQHCEVGRLTDGRRHARGALLQRARAARMAGASPRS